MLCFQKWVVFKQVFESKSRFRIGMSVPGWVSNKLYSSNLSYCNFWTECPYSVISGKLMFVTQIHAVSRQYWQQLTGGVWQDWKYLIDYWILFMHSQRRRGKKVLPWLRAQRQSLWICWFSNKFRGSSKKFLPSNPCCLDENVRFTRSLLWSQSGIRMQSALQSLLDAGYLGMTNSSQLLWCYLDIQENCLGQARSCRYVKTALRHMSKRFARK